MNAKHILKWNIAELSTAMKIAEDDVISYFTDGRRVSFLLERHLSKLYEGALAKSERDSYDFEDIFGGKWEVRSITKSGTFFSPSIDVGGKREFNEENLLNKIKNLAGYILCDVTQFPEVKIYEIPSNTVIKWFKNRDIGKNASPALKKIQRLIAEL